MESKVESKVVKYVTVVVAEEIKNIGSRYFLIAPNGYHFDKNDEVVSRSGREFKVLFASSYTLVNSELFTALKVAFGTPGTILIYKTVKNVEWGDENEDTADTSCDDACRSGSGDGDGNSVH